MKKFSKYLTIKNKILIMPFFAISALFLLFFVSQLFMDRNVFLLSQIESRFVPALELGRDMEYLLTEMQRTMHDAVSSEDAEKLYSTEAIYDALLNLSEKDDNNFRLEHEHKKQLALEIQDYYSLAQETSLWMIQGKPLDEKLISNLNRMREQYNTLKTQLQSKTARAKKEVSISFATALKNSNHSKMIMNTVILSCVLFMGLLSLFLIRSIIKPLQNLMTATNRIAQGDLTHEISVGTDDELEMLGNAMERMRQELRDFYQQLEDLVEKRTRQLRQSQKLEALGKMAGGTAHEFNNILAIIMGAMELILEELPDGSKQKQQLKQAYKTGERGRELVKEILIFSRSSQKQTVALKLDQILENAVTIIQPTLPQDVTICSHIQPSTYSISGNALQIEQIIINLCNNAAQAMIKKQGIIDIRLDETDSGPLDSEFTDFSDHRYVRFSVSDNGSGIPPDIQKHIFDPFFTTKEVGKGTGLGLSVVHGIVRQYGGRINVKSELGKGTSFKIIFPAVREKHDPAPQTSPDSKHRQDNKKISAAKKQILIIDNDTLSMRLPVMGLKKLGYNVTLASESSEALGIFFNNATKFDLVITKLSMPEISGIEIGRKIRFVSKDIPILLCMEPHETLDHEDTSSAGIVKFLHKPLTVRQLAQTILEIFGDTRKNL